MFLAHTQSKLKHKTVMEYFIKISNAHPRLFKTKTTVNRPVHAFKTSISSDLKYFDQAFTFTLSGISFSLLLNSETHLNLYKLKYRVSNITRHFGISEESRDLAMQRKIIQKLI